MIERILDFSIRWRVLMLLVAAAIVAAGAYAAVRLPIDAVPDITSNQVQINTIAPGFAPEEMERYVTVPIEVAMSSMPRKEEIRSISQFGLSQVTVTFADDVDIYWARQLVLERLLEAERELPPGVSPELAPVSTGLGEIYQFTVERAPAEGQAPVGRPSGAEADEAIAFPGSTGDELTDLRTILDWYITPQLRTVPGVIEVNSYGGREKQYEVLVDPRRLAARGLTLRQLVEALGRNNRNAGGAYLERGGEQQIIRGVGLIQNLQDVENIVVAAHSGTPVYVRDVARVQAGAEIRQGAATRDGQGETVIGVAMLLKGENSRTVTDAVRQRLEAVQRTLPRGIVIKPFYERTDLVNATIRTAATNLIEGGLLVVGILFLFLLQLRAGLIVSAAIPLSMLIAIVVMWRFNISANLMSLGAIDFGLIVDGAVIIVENTVRRLAEARHRAGKALEQAERLALTRDAAVEVLKPALFGMVIIIAAYLPIVTLGGTEGRMFRPMAYTVIAALVGALILSMTVIPALSALFLKATGRERENRVLDSARARYSRLLRSALDNRAATVGAALAFCVVSGGLATLLGTEFLPDLDEGALVVNHVRVKSVALTESVRQAEMIENTLKKFPEVQHVVSRIGRPEIATDPMGPDMADTYAILKPHDQWRPGVTTQSLFQEIGEELEEIPGVVSSLSQPIKFRMAELLEGIGVRSDVGIKLFGDDLDVLQREAQKVANVVRAVNGAEDVRVQQVAGLPVLQLTVDREKVARYGINVGDVQEVIETAIAGTEATTVLEGFMRFDLVVRFAPELRRDTEALGSLLVQSPDGTSLPLGQLTKMVSEEGPAEVSRENGQRRITVEANVRGRDLGSFVSEAQARVERDVSLTPGYRLEWGGTFEQLESGRRRLMVVVPLTFLVIFLLLFVTFNSLRQAGLVFTGIPFAVTGGILGLLLRGMNFSMSAGVG
ncbi:MAG TPA: CusA/CzcA family heavy metal efflux RND transporter, partial [Vicinamibacterales bacterium]|nr:CusA/CzcA family heavy metal efflux RND transporter [Vicinamibacterales bacterium]